MQSTPRKTVAAVFDTHTQAEQAIQDLRKAAFRDDQIGYMGRKDESVLTKDVIGRKPLPGEETEVEEGAGVGAAAGVVIGGLAGVLASLIPGVGPFLTAGTLAGIIFGAGAGAAGGALVGALVGMEIPEEEARFYETELKAGRSLVIVKVDGRYNEALTILHRNGGREASSRTPAATATPATARR